MRIVGIIVLILVCLAGLAAGGGYLYLTKNFPNVGPAPDIKIVATPEMIARGKYLAEHVAGCIDCHSARNFQYYSGPIVPGSQGKGGFVFDNALMGIPGTLHAANITPAGIGDWTDGEVYRAITTGVKKDGTAMFPLMPYLNFGTLDDYDLKSIIAYIRTLQPIENKVPPSHLDFPLNLIVRTIPKPAAPQARPDPSDELAYGGYMMRAAGCGDCHTPIGDKGKPIDSLAFAGGMEFHFPTGFVNRSANITPDLNTGIGKWTKEEFIARFRQYTDSSVTATPLDSTAFNTAMPWTLFSGMTDQDLGAIYTYLRTVKPVNHVVMHFERELMAAH
jgi:mono/diheme cytochrome c family protein